MYHSVCKERRDLFVCTRESVGDLPYTHIILLYTNICVYMRVYEYICVCTGDFLFFPRSDLNISFGRDDVNTHPC